jgi:hypothetical protein
VPKLLTQLDLTCDKLMNRGKTPSQIATKWFGLSHPVTHHFTAVLINGVRVKRSVRLDDREISVRLKATKIATPKPTSRSRTVHNKLTVAQLISVFTTDCHSAVYRDTQIQPKLHTHLLKYSLEYYHTFKSIFNKRLITFNILYKNSV